MCGKCKYFQVINTESKSGRMQCKGTLANWLFHERCQHNSRQAGESEV